jgi:hypothetical protein
MRKRCQHRERRLQRPHLRPHPRNVAQRSISIESMPPRYRLAGPRETRGRTYPSFERAAAARSLVPGRAAAKRAREDDDQMSTAIKNSVEDEGPSSFHPEHMELAMAADEATTAQAAHSRYCFICMEEPLTANVGGLATVSHVDRDYLMTCAHKVCSNCAPGYLHDAEKKEGERGFDVAPKQCVTVLEPPNRTRTPEPGTSARS